MQLILLLDEDAPTAEALCELLEYEGYSCIQASTGTRGLGVLIDRHPALVILGDGFVDMDVATFLRAKEAIVTVAATPLIVTTADPRIRELAGAAALLVKPYGIEELLRVIRKHLPTDDQPLAA